MSNEKNGAGMTYRQRKAAGLVKPRNKKVGGEVFLGAGGGGPGRTIAETNPKSKRDQYFPKEKLVEKFMLADMTGLIEAKERREKIKKEDWVKNTLLAPFRIIWFFFTLPFRLVRFILKWIFVITFIVGTLGTALFAWKDPEEMIIKLGEKFKNEKHRRTIQRLLKKSLERTFETYND